MGPITSDYPMAESWRDALFVGFWALVMWSILIIVALAIVPAVLIARLAPTNRIRRWWYGYWRPID